MDINLFEKQSALDIWGKTLDENKNYLEGIQKRMVLKSYWKEGENGRRDKWGWNVVYCDNNLYGNMDEDDYNNDEETEDDDDR